MYVCVADVCVLVSVCQCGQVCLSVHTSVCTFIWRPEDNLRSTWGLFPQKFPTLLHVAGWLLAWTLPCVLGSLTTGCHVSANLYLARAIESTLLPALFSYLPPTLQDVRHCGLALLGTSCSLCTFSACLRNPGSSALPWRPLFSIESPLLPWERPMLCLACLALVGSHSKYPYQNLECSCQQNRPQSRVRIIPHSDIEMWLRFPSWHTWLSWRMWLSWVVICLDFSSSKMRIPYA